MEFKNTVASSMSNIRTLSYKKIHLILILIKKFMLYAEYNSGISLKTNILSYLEYNYENNFYNRMNIPYEKIYIIPKLYLEKC